MRARLLRSTAIGFAVIGAVTHLVPKAAVVTSVLAAAPLAAGEATPSGQRITPTALPAAVFQGLNPNLPALPDFTAGQAAAVALSPDGRTLLVLTSGYNRNLGPDGEYIPELSNEYVFVYDVAGPLPVKRQVLTLPNSFLGLAWHPSGERFYVAGGVDDNVHAFVRGPGGGFAAGDSIGLGHAAGVGIEAAPQAAGLAVDPDGKRLLVANYQNESVSLVDLDAGRVVAEQDLRPGIVDLARVGEPGGTYPNLVWWASSTKAYVTSQRDRELITLALDRQRVAVSARLRLSGQPAALAGSGDRDRLFVALDNSDRVLALDTGTDRVLEEIPATAPTEVFLNPLELKGANPNGLALSPDERTLFVTLGGLNAVSVVQLGGEVLAAGASGPNAATADLARVEPAAGAEAEDGGEEGDAAPARSRVIGLMPTGWYPTAVAARPDGGRLFVVNGKSNAGPNPLGCRANTDAAKDATDACKSADQYVWQLEKAGLLATPMPSAGQLARLTQQVAANNDFPGAVERARDEELMTFLRAKIRHVVYVVKENRTYDQVLGDLEVGDGDPSLALLPEPITPNHHAIARAFVTLDSFLDSGETSNTGWNWTTAARTTDFTERTSAVNYADRGLQYDWEGLNRNINVGLPTVEARRAANPVTPEDPNVLAGGADVAAPDGPGNEAGTGYLWDAALRAGLTVRNYGFYGDLSRYDPDHPARFPLLHEPKREGLEVFVTTKASLRPVTDPYFRGYDMAFPDFWRFKEWEREFDGYVAKGELPALTLLRLPHDHFGSFDGAIDGVGTVETQMADNDYAVGLVLEKLARSRFAPDTLVFVIEDDAQNGADHVDAHRSIALVAGPYVKQGAVVSERYTTVSLLRTIEEVLAIPPMGLNDGLAAPMAAIFDPSQAAWSYEAQVPSVLRTTELPLPPPGTRKAGLSPVEDGCFTRPRRTAAYWAQAMAGQDFAGEDRLDTGRFNAALWHGLKGEAVPLPGRHQRDLRTGRAGPIAAFRRASGCALEP